MAWKLVPTWIMDPVGGSTMMPQNPLKLLHHSWLELWCNIFLILLHEIVFPPVSSKKILQLGCHFFQALRTSSMAQATVGTNAAEPQALPHGGSSSELVCALFPLFAYFCNKSCGHVKIKGKKRLVNCKHKYHVRRFREIVLMSSLSRSCPRHRLNLFLTLGKQMSSNDGTAVIQSYSLPQQRILSLHNQIEKSVLLPTTKHGFIYHEVWAKSDTRLHVGAGENKVSGQFLTSSNLFSGGFPYQAIWIQAWKDRGGKAGSQPAW